MTLLDEYDSKLEATDWKVYVDDHKNGLNIWTKTATNGLKAMKAEAIIENSNYDIYNCLGDKKYRKDYDETYDDSYNIQRIGD